MPPRRRPRTWSKTSPCPANTIGGQGAGRVQGSATEGTADAGAEEDGRAVGLLRIIILGLGIWLAFEAAASAWYGVWFNAGVDVGVFLMFSIPAFMLLRRMEGGPRVTA